MTNLFENLQQYHRSDTALLLGSGPSINTLQPHHLSLLGSWDVWSLNNFVYHQFIYPDFYFLQVKRYNFHIIGSEFAAKQKQYRKTVFLYHAGKTITLNDGTVVTSKDVVDSSHILIPFSLKKRWATDADYTFDSQRLTCTCNASISFCIETLYRLNYQHVILLGVDLYTSTYFWSDPSVYPTVHHRTNKQRDPAQPHHTFAVKDFIVDARSEWFVPKGRSISVATKETALYPDLPYSAVLEDAAC